MDDRKQLNIGDTVILTGHGDTYSNREAVIVDNTKYKDLVGLRFLDPGIQQLLETQIEPERKLYFTSVCGCKLIRKGGEVHV